MEVGNEERVDGMTEGRRGRRTKGVKDGKMLGWRDGV